jgi:hypothetical protein
VARGPRGAWYRRGVNPIFTHPATGQSYAIISDPPGGYVVRDVEDGPDLGRFVVVTGKVRRPERLSDDLTDADFLRIAEAFVASLPPG